MPEKRKSLDKKHLRRIYKERVYYILLFAVMCLCLFMLLRGTGTNIIRLISLNRQINELNELNKNALQKNYQLKEELKIYSSYSGIEELARNNLKMVGKDEVLVLIRKP